MRYQPALQGVSIVLVGNFNPAIFTPAWFALNELIDLDELNQAKTQIVMGEYSEILLGNRKISAQPERFFIETTTEPFVEIMDIALGTFGTILPHTPIRHIGINYTVHFALDSAEQRIALGRALAPTEPWGPWGNGLIEDRGKIELVGGLRSLIMEHPAPDGRPPGDYRRVQIEPSVKAELLDPYLGVYMAINDHHLIEADPEKLADASGAMEFLNEAFDLSIAASKSIVSEIMEFAGTLK